MKITDKYVFFYNDEFSQWHTASMIIDDVAYNCAEQYMMHQKALLFKDYNTAKLIMSADYAGVQKKLGRAVNNFNRRVWDRNCLSIVYRGNLAKFSQNTDLKRLLLSYGDRFFVEAAERDAVWGIGLNEYSTAIENPIIWEGTNLLGTVLTMVRNELKE